jgi:hypothetical protein
MKRQGPETTQTEPELIQSVRPDPNYLSRR